MKITLVIILWVIGCYMLLMSKNPVSSALVSVYAIGLLVLSLKLFRKEL